LNRARKKRKVAADIATVESIRGWKLLSSHAPHLATAPGITSLDYQISTGLVATGGLDRCVKLFDLRSSTTTATLSGHSKKVTGVLLHPTVDAVLSSSADCTVVVWNNHAGTYRSAFTLKPHTDAVVGIALHPQGDYLLSASVDRTWSFSDITMGRVLATFADDAITTPYTCVQVHPDGLLAGTGSEDSIVRLWDLKKNQTNVAKLEDHSGKISALAFSENGYYMASAADNGAVVFWDLRKMKKLHEASLGSDGVSSLVFDGSGSYAAAGTNSRIAVFNVADFSTITTLGGHTGDVTGVRFGDYASTLVSGSLDKSIHVYGQ